MKRMKLMLARFFHDESGGEVLEYVLIAGLIIVGCIAVLGAFGTKVLARWNSVNSSL
jgi:Flp pilus assembly pilin Flp